MDPQTTDLDHGRPLLDPFENHALRLLKSLQLCVRLEAQPLAERFGDNNAPGFIDPKEHTIYTTIYHSRWQSHDGGFGTTQLDVRRPLAEERDLESLDFGQKGWLIDTSWFRGAYFE
jgi:hypothetical protein